jgi:hypothetical protein
MYRIIKHITIACFLIHICGVVNGQGKRTILKFGGYAKTDLIFTQYNNGDISTNSPLRDFHIPGLIPVGDTDKNSYTDFHVKESRFYFDIATDKSKWPLRAYIELDFLLSSAGNEQVSNSYNPRLRHFYFEAGKLLFGQTWSTFMVVVLPEDLDLPGASDGVVFIRQPQIRLTLDSWQLSLENPTTTLSQLDENLLIVTEAGRIPDLSIRKNFKGEWGNLSVATLFRQLNARDSSNSNKTAFGYGITTGAKINIGKRDDLRFVATYGNGLGRYVAFNYVSGAAFNSSNELKPIGTINAHIAYLHYWSEEWKTSLNLSAFNAHKNNSLTGNDGNKKAWSASANILYSPIKNLMMGVEFMHAYRELEGGANGSFERLQFSARYLFGWSSKN